MLEKKQNIFLLWKEELITSAVTIACLALFFVFPASGPAQAITAGLVFFFLVPFLYLKFILKKSLQDYGWRLGDWKKGIVFAAISLAVSLLIFYAFYHYTQFSKAYRLPLVVTQKFGWFLIYEFVLVGFFLALYEFFFRGFILFSFRAKLGRLSVAVQWLIFLAFLFIAGNLNWQNALYAVVALFSGLIVFKSHSLLYSFIFGLFFIIISDAILIKLLY